MGLSITRDHFTPSEFEAFSEKVRLDLNVLKQLLQRDGFGEGES